MTNTGIEYPSPSGKQGEMNRTDLLTVLDPTCGLLFPRVMTNRWRRVFLCQKDGYASSRDLSRGGFASAPACFHIPVVRLHLTEDHAVIGATGTHELFVGSPLDDAAIFHHQDQVGAADRGKAMG